MRHIARGRRKVGLPAIRFHDLRHTSATLLLGSGTHPKVVQERLGHATIGITMDMYSHVLPGMQEQAAASLEALLGGPGSGLASGLASTAARGQEA